MKLDATLFLAAATALAALGCHDRRPEAASTTHVTSSTLSDPSGASEPSSLTSAAGAARTDEVRNALRAAGTFKDDAKNLDVATHAGVITLRGTVASEQEKSLVEATALGVAGGDAVDNQLDVTNASTAVLGQGTRYGAAPSAPPSP